MSNFEHDSIQLAADESVDMVQHPPHYQPPPGVAFDCIEVVRDMSFDVGNVVKYLWRSDRKNGRQDLEKALWYLEDAIKYGDPIYIGHTPMQWHSRMSVIIRAFNKAENYDAATIFGHIRDGQLGAAAIALKYMTEDA